MKLIKLYTAYGTRKLFCICLYIFVKTMLKPKKIRNRKLDTYNKINNILKL